MEGDNQRMGAGPAAYRPYKDVHIYLLEGVVAKEDEPMLGEDFLGNWVEDSSSFLFFSVPSREKVDALLRTRRDLRFIEEHCFTYEEWQGSKLQTVKIHNFLVVAPWERAEPEEGEQIIMLDPGVVFGTGIHPTTRDCVSALAHVFNQTPISKVLDFGTGSGILALAAAFLGADRVLAVDLNPLAVKTAQKNVTLNHLENVIKVAEGNVMAFAEEPADLVMSNIHHEVMAKLIGTAGFRKNAWLILSGLMRSQVRDIKTRLERHGLRIMREWDHDGTWSTLLVRGAPPNEVTGKGYSILDT
jgi:ribosomal protein L11 methyltransferase